MNHNAINAQGGTRLEIPFSWWYAFGRKMNLFALPFVILIGTGMFLIIFLNNENATDLWGFLPIWFCWVSILWLMRDEWKRWWSKRPALILTDTGITTNVLPFDIGEIPWADIAEIKDRTTLRLTKEVKLMLNTPTAWIEREPRLRYRLLMRWMAFVLKTPLMWYSRHLGEKHDEVIRQIRTLHATAQGDLSRHLVDD